MLCVVVLLALGACRDSSLTNEGVFYDLDSLIDQQVAYLARLQPTLEKEAEIDGEQERVTIDSPDSTVWAKELSIFRQLDLNAKALNAARYEISTGLRDVASNLNIIEYTAKEDLPLSQVRIYYEGDPGKVRRIEGKFRSKESNRLYSSGQFLSMEMIDINSHAMLTQYQVIGGQKMILGDTIRYSVAGALTYE